MNVAGLIFGLSIPIVLGLIVARLLGLHQRHHPTLVLGAAFGIGLAFVSLTMACLPLIGFRLTFSTGVAGIVVMFLLTLAVLIWHGGWRGGDAGGRVIDVRLRGWARWGWAVGVLGLGMTLMLTCSRATLRPVLGWDAFTVHSLRAKVFFYDQTISFERLLWIGNADYPLGFPLTEVWVAWWYGPWNDTAFKVLFPCLLAALFLVFYGGLRRASGPIAALTGTWFLAASPLLIQHATDAFLDLPLAYTTLGTSVFLWAYAHTRARGDLWAASALATYGLWIKNEGGLAFFLVWLLLGFLLITRGTLGRSAVLKELIVFGAIPLAVWMSWTTIKNLAGLPDSLAMNPSSFVEHMDRLPNVLSVIGRELWSSANWHILWALFVGSWVIGHFRRSFEPAFLFFGWPVALTFTAFIVVSEGTVMYTYLLNGTTLHRITLHVAPLAAFLVALTLTEFYKRRASNSTIERSDSVLAHPTGSSKTFDRAGGVI